VVRAAPRYLLAGGGSNPSSRGAELAAKKIADEMAQGNPRLPGACFQSSDDIGLDGYFVMTVSQFRHHPDEGQRGSAGPHSGLAALPAARVLGAPPGR